MTKKTFLSNLSTSAISSVALSEEESSFDVSMNQLKYSISMIDNLLKRLRQNLSDRIFMADNMAIESLDSWCRSIGDHYSLYDSLLLPFYSKNNHWVLVYINTKNHFFAYIDPIGSSVAPDSLLNGLSNLKEKQAIQFNEVYISPIILQQDTYQCGPWLVLITQNLLAHGMAYNSYQLARILIFLSSMDIASIRLEQQNCLGLGEDIVPLFEISPYSKELINVSNKEPENALASDISAVSSLGKRLRQEVDDVNLSQSDVGQRQYFLLGNNFTAKIIKLLSDYNNTLTSLDFTKQNIELLIKNRGAIGLEALLMHGLPLLNRGLSPSNLIEMLPKIDIVNLLVFLNDERNWALLTASDGMNLSLSELIKISPTYNSHEKLQLLIIGWPSLITIFTKQELVEMALKKNAQKQLYLLVNNWDRVVSPEGLNCSNEFLKNLTNHSNGTAILECLLDSILSENPVTTDTICTHTDNNTSPEIIELLFNHNDRLASLGFTSEMSAQFIKTRGLISLQALFKYGMPLGKQDFAPYYLINSLPKTDIVSLLTFLNDEKNWALVTTDGDMKLSRDQIVNMAKVYGGAETLQLLIDKWQMLRHLFTKAQLLKIALKEKASKTLKLILGETNSEENWFILTQKFKFTREQIISMASTHNAKTRLKLLIENYAKIIALSGLKCTRTLLLSLFKQHNGTDILQLLLNSALLRLSVYDEKSLLVSHKMDLDNYDHQLQIFLTAGKFPPDIAEVLSNNYGKLRKLAFTNNNIIVLIKKIGLTGFNSLLAHGLPLLSKGFSPDDLINMLPMTKKGIVRLFDFLNDQDNWTFLTAPNGMNLFHNELVMIGKNFSSTATLELLMIHWQTLNTLFTKAQIISIASHRCAKRRVGLLINNWDKLVYLNNLNYPLERLVIFLRQKNGVDGWRSLFELSPIFFEEVIREEVVFNSADELQRQELLAFLENIGSDPTKGVINSDEQVVSPNNEGLDFSSHSFFRAVSPPSLLHHIEPIIDDFGYGVN